MSASENLNPQQFMPVSDLMGMYSADALGVRRNDVFNRGKDPHSVHHGEGTRMHDVYDRKAADITEGTVDYSRLDDHIRSGSIDPVVLNTTDRGETEIADGTHRIVRAHQLGVIHLPVSHDESSQKHLPAWNGYFRQQYGEEYPS